VLGDVLSAAERHASRAGRFLVVSPVRRHDVQDNLLCGITINNFQPEQTVITATLKLLLAYYFEGSVGCLY
jgi:hypothetical protein